MGGGIWQEECTHTELGTEESRQCGSKGGWPPERAAFHSGFLQYNHKRAEPDFGQGDGNDCHYGSISLNQKPR